MMGHVTDTTNSLSTLPIRYGNPLDTDMGPTTVDMASRITPRHKPITPKATILFQTSMTTTTVVVRARLTKGNPESTTPQKHPRRIEGVLRANQPSILLVSHFGSRSRCSPLYSVSAAASRVNGLLMTVLCFVHRRPSRKRSRVLHSCQR
jgi:hypothetical protein